MTEHARIAKFFAPLTVNEPGSFALTDDAAALMPLPGYTLVVTTDSVIEGIHVLPGATPQQFAQKLVRRNLSDLAAMGAESWWYLVNLHTPAAMNDRWFADFADALAREQREFGITLVGGDTTSGGDIVHTTMTCIGMISTAPLRRNGARVGDNVYVSGTIGDAALGLQLLQQKLTASEAHRTFLTNRYHRPQPRLDLGCTLYDTATSCIDISDGLLADAQAIATASGVGMHIQRDAIPLSDAARACLAQNAAWWEAIISGGDDYELLFTASPEAQGLLAAVAESFALPLTCIGTVVEGAQVVLCDHTGDPLPATRTGWQH